MTLPSEDHLIGRRMATRPVPLDESATYTAREWPFHLPPRAVDVRVQLVNTEGRVVKRRTPRTVEARLLFRDDQGRTIATQKILLSPGPIDDLSST